MNADLRPEELAKPMGENNQTIIARLAALHPLEYEKVRKEEADRLQCRASELDKLVSKARPRGAGDETEKKPLCAPIDPWPDPVHPAELLDEIHATIRSFIVCNEETSLAATLWIAFTWFIEQVQVAPLLIITAPEMRCGKTQTLDCVGRLSCRPILASSISPAAVYRTIEAHSPTLLIDEADSFLKENEELRGVINSGHTRQSAYVIRTVGDDHVPQRFTTWGAKALSGIGHLQRTLMDRAIVLELRRKLKTERVRRLRHADPGLFEQLASKLARFAEDAGSAIRQARPTLPDELNDRAQDNWEPLLAIADHAGGVWPDRARWAARELAGVEQEPMSLAAQLLADAREVFMLRGWPEKISSADLITELTKDEHKPWRTSDHGRPVTSAQISKLLKGYGIKPKDHKFPGGTLKGYAKPQFQDAWERYLAGPDAPPVEAQPATSEYPCGPAGCTLQSQGATARNSQPGGEAMVAPLDATRNLGATREAPPALNSCEVAASRWGPQTDAPIVPLFTATSLDDHLPLDSTLLDEVRL